MINLSTSNKKWIIGAVLGLVVIFLLAFTLEVFAVELGGYIDAESVKFYTDSEGYIRIRFEVDTTFEIHYETRATGEGYCDHTYTAPYEDEWRVFGSNFFNYTSYISPFVQTLDIQATSTNPTCEDATETYTAGEEYNVYVFYEDDNAVFRLGEKFGKYEDWDLLIKDDQIAGENCQQEKSGVNNCPFDEADFIKLKLDDVEYSNEFYWERIASILITYPPSNSEISDTFTMEIDYFEATGYNQLIIWFEDWDIDDCPDFDEPSYQEEKDLYFNNQSRLYFSAYFTTSTGTTTIEISDIETGNYNCNMCRFFHSITTEMSSRLCKGYIIKILEYIPPVDIPILLLPISSWTDYYAEHSERYTTSTPIFTSMAETFSPLISWFGNTILFFNNYFDPETAGNKGEEIGNAVRIARGYLESIDDFFGGLPISTIFIFYLITAIVVIIYRLVRGILTIIIP